MHNHMKRFLSLLMAFAMVFSLLPVQAFASETEEHTHEEEIIELQEAPEIVEVAAAEEVVAVETTAPASENLTAVQAEIDAILVTYGITADMTTEQINATVSLMDIDSCILALEAVYELEYSDEVMYLTESELQMLVDKNVAYIDFVDALQEKYASEVNVTTLGTAIEVTPIENVLVSLTPETDGKGTCTTSNGTVTITSKSATFGRENNYLYIYNKSDATATLSFSYSLSSLSNCNNFQLNSVETSTTTDTVSVMLEAGASYYIYFRVKAGGKSVTLTLSNFSLVAAAEASDVTVNYDSSLGSVTMGDATVASGDVQSVTLGSSITLTAAATSGVTFYGWINEADGAILTTAAALTLTPANDITVKPVFAAASSSYFMVGTASQATWDNALFGLTKNYYHTVAGAYIFEGLSAATTAASASSLSKVVIPLSDVTLTGENTIPAGVTLLVPFDNVYTMYTTEAQTTGTDIPATVTAFRTVTLADGASLIINGAVSLSAKHCRTQTTYCAGSSPSGSVSFLKMGSGSTITVNNGGALYAYGYITGSGTVTAKNGAKVYENFQVADFRGGTATTSSDLTDNEIFPMSQFYIQNIEVPITYEYGAKGYVLATIYMSSAEFDTQAEFIGSSGMFSLTASGSTFTKSYDGSTDRLNAVISGSAEVRSFSLNIGGTDVNSADYIMPLNNNMSVTLASGSNITVSQDMNLVPGNQFIIESGATCTLGSGTRFYIYDADQWGGYCSSSTAKFRPLYYAPGRTYTRTETDLVDAMVQVDGTVDASAGYAYTTAGGANIFSTGNGVAKINAGTDTVTYQASQASSTITVVEIPITPAKLKNADGSYRQSSTDTYTYTDGAWLTEAERCEHTYTNNVASSEIATPATCTEAATYYVQCDKECGTINKELTVAVGKPNGHTETDLAAVAPTCTATGLTAGKKCSTCGTITVAQTEVAATGHNYRSVVTDPTCTEAGYTTHTCANCGNSYKDTDVAATGHNYSSVVTNPTCSKQGYTTHTCSACGDTYQDTYVDATGNHVYDSGVVTTNPTCTEAGVKTYTCGTCGNTYTETVAAAGHSYDAGIVTPPTCTEKGYTTYTCGTCGDSYKDNEVAAKGHTEVVDEAKAPTCTATGLTEGKHCSVCNEVIVAQTEVAATGHTASAAVKENEVEATCTTAGSYDSVVYCSVCDAEISRTTEAVATLGHSYDAVVTAPTCEDAGYTTYTCSACGDSYVSDNVEAVGHSYEGSVTTAPDCNEQTDGIMTNTCKNCGDSYTEDISWETAHDYQISDEVDPTCDEDGYTTYTCTICEDWYDVIDEGTATGHDYQLTETFDPTCGDQGYSVYTCSNCKDWYEDDFVNPTEQHDFSYHIKTVEATCTEDGYEIYECMDCTKQQTTVLKATDHAYEGVVTTEPTCTEKGVKTYTCKNDSAHTYTEEIAATGHNYEAVVTEPTCTEDGYTTYTCACGDSYTDDEVAAAGHSYVDGKCSACGITQTITQYTVGQNAQIRLIEPWGLKANAKFSLNGNVIDYSTLYDYGVYFIRQSEMDQYVAGMTQEDISVEFIINDSDATHIGKDGITVQGDGYLAAIYDKSLYTYEFGDSVYVLYYVVTNEGESRFYAPVRERIMSDLVVKQRDNTKLSELEREVYKHMALLEEHIVAYREGKDTSVSELMKAPTLANYSLGELAETTEYTFSHNNQIRLIEPWGLKVNCAVKQNGSIIDYNTVDEYGVIILADNGATIISSEDLLSQQDAYIFSSKNGDVQVQSNGYLTALYNKGIYTYQMNSDFYVAFYVVDETGVHMGPLKIRNVYELIPTINGSEEEELVYTDMLNLYHAITEYRK